MAKSYMFLGVVGIAIGFWLLERPSSPAPLHEAPWWGRGAPREKDEAIRPTSISVSDKDLKDLQERLMMPLRTQPGLEGANFTYGINGETLHMVVDYWLKNYRWRTREARLNTLSHYATNIEGLDIHFVRREPRKNSSSEAVTTESLPLLMLHGWPGSFVEFFDILPLLAAPQKSGDVVFDVICPSLPGFAYSEAPARAGLGIHQTAQIFLKLMKRLGHERFYVHGGDWGAEVATAMATRYPKNVRGVHVTMFRPKGLKTLALSILGSFLPSGSVIEPEEEYMVYPMWEKFKFMLRETGYLHIQVTKPDTIGAALSQTPAGLAAYILEKFSTGTRLTNVHKPTGGFFNEEFPISLLSLLDNICVYWFSNCMTSSMRYYAENWNSVTDSSNVPCTVPAGLAAFPQEAIVSPRSLAAYKFLDIVTYTRPKVGGHFAAMEQPAILAADIRKFVTAVERRSRAKITGV